MGLNFINNIGPFKKLLLKGWAWDARYKYERIKSCLSSKESILDIGSGYGTVTDYLRKQSFEVTPLDVQDQSIDLDLKPVIYDGNKIPFENGTFQTALLLTVLHHTPNPKEVLAEALRVAHKTVIIEDVYRNKIQQYLTYAADSLFNFEFRGHPHSNKTRHQWFEIFKELGVSAQLIRSDRFLWFFRQETYLLI